MPAKVDRCVADLLPRLIDDYKKEHGHAPSDKRKKELEQSAWAICTESVEGGDVNAEGEV